MSVWCGNVRQHIPSHQTEERNTEVRHAVAPPVPSPCCILHVDWNGTLSVHDFTVCEKTKPAAETLSEMNLCMYVYDVVCASWPSHQTISAIAIDVRIDSNPKCFYDEYWNSWDDRMLRLLYTRGDLWKPDIREKKDKNWTKILYKLRCYYISSKQHF